VGGTTAQLYGRLQCCNHYGTVVSNAKVCEARLRALNYGVYGVPQVVQNYSIYGVNFCRANGGRGILWTYIFSRGCVVHRMVA
jgi:hypothetical protein